MTLVAATGDADAPCVDTDRATVTGPWSRRLIVIEFDAESNVTA